MDAYPMYKETFLLSYYYFNRLKIDTLNRACQRQCHSHRLLRQALINIF